MSNNPGTRTLPDEDLAEDNAAISGTPARQGTEAATPTGNDTPVPNAAGEPGAAGQQDTYDAGTADSSNTPVHYDTASVADSKDNGTSKPSAQQKEDSVTDIAWAIVKSLVGFDDDLDEIIERKLMGLITDIDDPGKYLNLEYGTPEELAAACDPKMLEPVLGVVTSVMGGISSTMPGILSSALGCNELTEHQTDFGTLGDEVQKRVTINTGYAKAYPDSKANPANSTSVESIRKVMSTRKPDPEDEEGRNDDFGLDEESSAGEPEQQRAAK